MKNAPFLSSVIETRQSATLPSTSLGTNGSLRFSERGFTLVELLVALFIFALLAAAGVALLRTAAIGQEVLVGRLDQLSIVNRVSGALASDMAQAMPRISRNRVGDPVPALVDNGGAIPGELFAFTRAGWSNYDAAPRSDLQRVAYSFDGQALRRSGWPMLDGSDPAEPATLMEGLESVTVRYRALDGSWRDDWTPLDPGELPRAVELILKPRGLEKFRLVMLVGPQSRERRKEAPDLNPSELEKLGIGAPLGGGDGG